MNPRIVKTSIPIMKEIFIALRREKDYDSDEISIEVGTLWKMGTMLVYGYEFPNHSKGDPLRIPIVPGTIGILVLNVEEGAFIEVLTGGRKLLVGKRSFQHMTEMT